jgi:hypothetical protein
MSSDTPYMYSVSVKNIETGTLSVIKFNNFDELRLNTSMKYNIPLNDLILIYFGKPMTCDSFLDFTTLIQEMKYIYLTALRKKIPAMHMIKICPRCTFMNESTAYVCTMCSQELSTVESINEADHVVKINNKTGGARKRRSKAGSKKRTSKTGSKKRTSKTGSKKRTSGVRSNKLKLK